MAGGWIMTFPSLCVFPLFFVIYVKGQSSVFKGPSSHGGSHYKECTKTLASLYSGSAGNGAGGERRDVAENLESMPEIQDQLVALLVLERWNSLFCREREATWGGGRQSRCNESNSKGRRRAQKGT